ncbi:MAG: hypothetical protein ACRDWY_12070 [Actinomycetes bacterium]
MRAPTGTLRLFALFVVVGLVALAGCSDDPDKPSTLPDDTPSAVSSSPTPDTPEEQVEAAVRAYYAELTRAAQTNDTSTLREMTTKGCPCYRAVRVINRNESQGERTPDALFEVTFLRVHDIEQGTALAEVKTSDAAYDVLDESDEVVATVDAQTTHVDLSLVKSGGGRWIVGNSFNLAG